MDAVRRSNGVPASRLLAGLQILVGYYAVAAPGHAVPATPLGLAAEDRSPSGAAPAPPPAGVTFAVQPDGIANPMWLIFRGTRDQRGGLAGEIVPDGQMRLLGLLPNTAFIIGGIGVAIGAVLLPLVTGGTPSWFAAAWASIALFVTSFSTVSCGAAVQEIALNVQCDSPGAQLTWRWGLRYGSRLAPPPPPPPEVRFAPGAPIAVPYPDDARFASDADRRRRRRWAWFGLLGLLMPIAVVMLAIVPTVRHNRDRTDWVRIEGVAGAEVDVDHRMVTCTLSDGTETTTEVEVMRTVEAGDAVDLYYPPGRPDLIEEDDSGYLLPFIFFGGFAALATALVLGRFAVQMYRTRRSATAPT